MPSDVEFVLPMDSYLVDLDEWVDKARRGDVLVRGFPHNTRFFEPHREWLAKELKPRDGDYTRSDLVLNLRLGDYLDTGNEKFKYPIEAIYGLLKSLDYDQCLIVTDSPENAIVEHLVAHHRGAVASKNPEHDYRTCYHAKRLIMTPSTFCWWSAFTGDAVEIYQPYEMGFWKAEHKFALDLPWLHVRRFDSGGRILDHR